MGKQIRKILEDSLLVLAVAFSKFRGTKALLAFVGRHRAQMGEILPHLGTPARRDLSPALIDPAGVGLFVRGKLSKEPKSLKG